MRKLVVLLAVVLSVLATAVPAWAITGNYVEDNEHPFVGLVVFYGEDGDDADEDPDFLHRCSFSLLTPTVSLNAGHCTDEATGETTAHEYYQQDDNDNANPETEL